MSIVYEKTALIISQDQIAKDIFNMVLEVKEMAEHAKAGQFINLFSANGQRLLPRPISICGIDKNLGRLRIVYRIAGAGTKEFSTMKPGSSLTVMGPLGNGFLSAQKTEEHSHKKALVIGGGIGIPPMLELAKQLNCDKDIVLGYRDELFLNDEFKDFGEVWIATEDGSTGVKGNVLDVIQEKNLKADVIYACGPTPMLRALQKYAAEHNIEARLSLEEHMACGIGACLACVCKSKEIDHHSNVQNKRVCKDGPVFLGSEVEL